MSELSGNQLFWNEFSIDDHTLDINLMRKLIDYADCSDEKHRFFERFNIIEFAIFIKELFTEKFKIFNILHKISNFLQEMQIMKEENTLMFNEKKYLESVNITIKQGLDKYAEKYKEKKIEFKKLKHTGYELNETIKQLKNEKHIL